MNEHLIDSIEALEAIYNNPSEASQVKESPFVTDEYRRLIDASPFVVLASSGPEGLDCSPRGDLKGFVRIHNDKTLMIPDRRGNNRVDTLRNIISDPRIALLFLIPGSGTTLRVNGRAKISTDPELLESFEEQGKPPRSVLIIDVETAYFQCARAILRSKLWDADTQADPKSLPSAGDILAAQTRIRENGGIDADAYDAEWDGRAQKTLW
ncbi:MAG: pyridoxamine 5'-phosphate oxidase family protein [Rhodospirillales bacterium]